MFDVYKRKENYSESQNLKFYRNIPEFVPIDDVVWGKL